MDTHIADNTISVICLHQSDLIKASLLVVLADIATTVLLRRWAEFIALYD